MLDTRWLARVPGYPVACKQIGSNDVAICQISRDTRTRSKGLVVVARMFAYVTHEG